MLHTYIAVHIQAWTDLLRILGVKAPGISGKSAHVVGKVVKPANRPHLPSSYTCGNHFCWSLRPLNFDNETGRYK